MNHDILKNSMNSVIMSIYTKMFAEYKNEQKAKKETYKIAAEVLRNFGATSDIYEAYDVLMKQYKLVETEEERHELYKKLEVLTQAVEIIKGATVNNGEY
jgi:hypothetical protein